jgi:MFS family permease
VLALYLAQAGLNEKLIGLLFTLTLAGDAVISLWLTTSADRAGRRRTLLLGALLMLGAGVVFILTRNPLLLMAAAIIGVISPSGNEIGPFLSVEQAGLAQLLPDQRRTQVFAWYNLSGSLATATGAICGGWLAPFDSYRAVLVGYAMGGLVLAILFLFLTAVIEVPVESSIPPFRGPGGLWNKYDPRMLELDYFLAHPDRSWPVFREIFYEHFDRAPSLPVVSEA